MNTNKPRKPQDDPLPRDDWYDENPKTVIDPDDALYQDDINSMAEGLLEED